MSKSSLFFTATLFLLVTGIFSNCKKPTNTINNGQVVETPYSLYFTDTAGGLYHSVDGKNFTVVFSPDGNPSRSIVTSGSNILWAKSVVNGATKGNLYYSTNNGLNFNHSYDSLYSIRFKQWTNTKGDTIDLNQTMLFDAPAWAHDYVSSGDPEPANYLGFDWSANFGILGSWVPENLYDTVEVTNPHAQITSFTQLADGTMIAFDGLGQRLFYRHSLGVRWMEGFVTPPNSLPVNPTGPGNGTGSFFTMGHLNNQIIAIDIVGNAGAFFSNDLGANWYPYTGLPAKVPLKCICSPFEQLCFVGTDSSGLYLLNPNISSFQANNNGLGQYTVVNGITFKETIYKNGTHQQFVYLATNHGIYMSTDLGANFTLTIPGNFVQIY